MKALLTPSQRALASSSSIPATSLRGKFPSATMTTAAHHHRHHHHLPPPPLPTSIHRSARKCHNENISQHCRSDGNIQHGSDMMTRLGGRQERPYSSMLASAAMSKMIKTLQLDEVVDGSDMEIADDAGRDLDFILNMVRQRVRLDANAAVDGAASAATSASRLVTREHLSSLYGVVGEESHPFSDPKKVIAHDLNMLVNNLPNTVKSNDAMVNSAAKYFFRKAGKMFRPTVVILAGKAVLAGRVHGNFTAEEIEQHMVKVRKLAEITEMIHVATLIHDDIVDESDTRRGVTTLHKILGNKTAVQSGDYLLARASFELANLESHEATRVIATAIEHLASGEISQMGNKGSDSFERYMQAIFCKTASIIANSARGAASLAGGDEHIKEQAYTYGKHLGLAYQLIDDVLDFTQSSQELGKPSQGADMKVGLATAPVLFASRQYPQLKTLIARQFDREGDIEQALKLVKESDGIQMTRNLALTHCKKAIEAIMHLEPSEFRSSLAAIVDKMRTRTK